MSDIKEEESQSEASTQSSTTPSVVTAASTVSTPSDWGKKSSVLLQAMSQSGGKSSSHKSESKGDTFSKQQEKTVRYVAPVRFDEFGGMDPEVFSRVEKEVKDLSEKDITEVHVDSGVFFNLVKNMQRKETISGVLLGAQQGNTLEVTYHFQQPSLKSGKSSEQNLKINKFQTKYLKNIKPFKLDNNIVGWYQSSSNGSFFSFESFQQQFINEKFLNNVSIMLVIEKKTRSFQLKAYRLSKRFLEYIQDTQRKKSEAGGSNVENSEEKKKGKEEEEEETETKTKEKRSLNSILKDLEMKIYNNYFPSNLEKEHFSIEKFKSYGIHLIHNYFKEIPVSITNCHGQLGEEFLKKNFSDFVASSLHRTPNTSNYMSQLILNYKIFQTDASDRKEDNDLDLILTSNKLKNSAEDLKRSYANELVNLFLLKNMMNFE